MQYQCLVFLLLLLFSVKLLSAEFDTVSEREREREKILFTKANIQYQYHKTITSGRLPEGITHQAGCL